MADSLTEALRYYEAGFSVFPLTPKSKRPMIKWGRYQKERADQAAIATWWGEFADAGIAIVAGEISGGLVVLDIDHFEFSKWMEERAEALNTWVVQTGSGKIHIYLRSKERCVTTELKSNDEFLADIRGDGQGLSGPSYLAAPPTIHPATERLYTTLYGDPFGIRTVDNANFLFTKIGEKFAGTAHLTAREGASAAPAAIPETPAVTQEYIEQKLTDEQNITGKIRRAILRDANPGEGEWAKTHSHSDIDFAVTCALLDAGWAEAEIHAVFAYLAIGAHHYRNSARPGRDYLARTLGAAMEKVERGREAARVAEGENFKIQRVIKVSWENPTYDLHFTNEHGQDRKAVIDHDDLFSELGFRKKLARYMSELPRLKAEHSGSKKKFESFANILLQMASIEDVPEAATATGHFRAEVKTELRRAMKTSRNIGEEPTAAEEFDILWADESSIYVRGHRLVNEMNKVMRADPAAVWDGFRAMNGVPQTVRYGEGGKISEEMWIIPRAALD